MTSKKVQVALLFKNESDYNIVVNFLNFWFDFQKSVQNNAESSQFLENLIKILNPNKSDKKIYIYRDICQDEKYVFYNKFIYFNVEYHNKEMVLDFLSKFTWLNEHFFDKKTGIIFFNDEMSHSSLKNDSLEDFFIELIFLSESGCYHAAKENLENAYEILKKEYENKEFNQEEVTILKKKQDD